MSTRLIVVVATAGLVLVGALVGSVGAEQAALPAGNVVKNPGGEIGPATTRNDTVLPVGGWETEVMPDAKESGFTQARYGSHNYFPTSAVSAAIGGGKSFLFGGPYEGNHVAHTSLATQTIDVGRAASDVDAGGVSVCLSGYLGGSRNWNQYTISAVVELLSAEGSRLGQLRIGPVTSAHRKNETTLLRRAANRPVPRGTRQLRLTLTGTSTTGGPTYGYADNLAVGLTKSACEPVLAARCVKSALVATVTPSSVMRTQRVRFVVKGGKRTKTVQDARAPYTGRFTMDGLTGKLKVTATVQQAGSGPIVLTKNSKRC